MDTRTRQMCYPLHISYMQTQNLSFKNHSKGHYFVESLLGVALDSSATLIYSSTFMWLFTNSNSSANVFGC